MSVSRSLLPERLYMLTVYPTSDIVLEDVTELWVNLETGNIYH